MSLIYDEQGNIVEGSLIKYYSEEDGKVLSETPYKNGKINGNVIEYHYNGNISSITPYVDGIVHGVEKIFYQSGMIMEVINYENGKISGKKYRYFETGLLEEEADYIKDVLHGFVIKYNSDGTVRLKQEFKKGFEVQIDDTEKDDEEISNSKDKDEIKSDLLTPEEMDRLLENNS